MRLSADIPVIAFLRTPTVGGDAIMYDLDIRHQVVNLVARAF